MELHVTRGDLQKELQLAQGVIERRSTIPILSNVLLKATEGLLEITATDLDITLHTSCPARVESPGGVTIEARRFFDIIRALPADDVRIAVDDHQSLLIEAGTARFRINGLPVEDYPTLPVISEDHRYSVPLVDLKMMISKVVFAITHEETRFQLNGALLKISPKKIEMVATDGHRMALVEYPRITDKKGLVSTETMTVLIPRKAMQEIARIEPEEDDETALIGNSENHLFFDIGRRRILSRVIDVNFPNYEEVIARDNDRSVGIDRDRLLGTIRRISLLANERTRAVRFDFAPGKLTVSSANPELGDARETVPIDYAGEPFHIGLNAVYVADFLSVLETPNVSLKLKDENAQCVARPAESDSLPYDYVYIVMPMRISDTR